MTTSPRGIEDLAVAFLHRHPKVAATRLEASTATEIAALLAGLPAHAVADAWCHLGPSLAEEVLDALPAEACAALVGEADPTRCVVILRRLEPARLEALLAATAPAAAAELRRLLTYPPESVGSLMDPRFARFRPEDRVDATLERLRAQRTEARRDVLLVDADERPVARVTLQALALARPDERLGAISEDLEGTVADLAPRDEVATLLDQQRVTKLAVVDAAGRLVGVVRQDGLVTALRDQASMGLQTMVGASREERTLSPATFAVRKRLPWLEINLLTAFLAASVVGLFEETIARFTALAVLLPVVAGQSGNAGAQALAVTMRGLSVREVSLRHLPKVVMKEVTTGLINGIAVGLTCAAAVGVWSQSAGLALVIGVSMVIAMVAAGFSGAIIPMVLVRLGQDPAQASSIILTTVTDVVGFFAFLGIATALHGIL